MILVPDTAQKAVYDAEIAPNLRPGQLLMFAHGFNIHFGRIDPPGTVDVGMVAPEGPRPPPPQRLPGRRRRAGAVRRPARRDRHGPRRASSPMPAALGSTRAGVLETTFKEETETDLFGEQSVLCGGTSALVKMAFETLVEAGYQPELAYFETMHELKLIVDLMYRGGLNFMRFSVSDTAEYGDYVVGPADHRRARPRDDAGRPRRHPGRHVREPLDRRAGVRPRTSSSGCARQDRDHQIEQVGRGAAGPDGVPQPGRRRGRRGPGGRRHGRRGDRRRERLGGRSRLASGSSTRPCATASRRPAPG